MKTARTAMPLASDIFTHKLDSKGSLSFGSRGGKIAGLDSDQILIFSKGGNVILKDHSASSLEYNGSYKIDKADTISVILKGYPGNWPIMKIIMQNDVLHLARVDGLTAPNAELQNEKHFQNYWPFGEIGN